MAADKNRIFFVISSIALLGKVSDSHLFLSEELIGVGEPRCVDLVVVAVFFHVALGLPVLFILS